MTDRPIDALVTLFTNARATDRAVLLPYLTAGLPDREASIRLFRTMADAGADGFEVGIPYADPLMDGPVIMAAGHRAIAQGVTVQSALEIASAVSSETGKPVLAMTYVNPVLRLGVAEFFRKVGELGVNGVIIPDLPIDEAAPFRAAAEESGVGLVAFAAPTTTDERLDAVLESDPAFVYAIAEVGVTGERQDASTNTVALAARIRERSDVPVVFGVGISTPEHAAAAGREGDGVIVGTAIVRRVMEAADANEAETMLDEFVSDLRSAMDKA